MPTAPYKTKGTVRRVVDRGRFVWPMALKATSQENAARGTVPMTAVLPPPQPHIQLQWNHDRIDQR